ncbi:hypothetical protein TNCV_185441 [Trichonephila clavipes]|nr:hypothetical protein TNCV_185441 [Trichonephila clavipes]
MDGVQELLEFYEQEQIIDELIENIEKDIEKIVSLDEAHSDDGMTIRNPTKVLSLIEKRLQILEKKDSNGECISSTKQGLKNYYHISHRHITPMPVNLRIGERTTPYSGRACEQLRHFVDYVIVRNGFGE